jgi:hypothetical protein
MTDFKTRQANDRDDLDECLVSLAAPDAPPPRDTPAAAPAPQTHDPVASLYDDMAEARGSMLTADDISWVPFARGARR